MNTYTINLKTENSEQFDAFLYFIKSFGLIELLNIKKEEIVEKQIEKTVSYLDDLVLPPKNMNKAKKHYGLWEKKNIDDLKQFRESLWQR